LIYDETGSFDLRKKPLFVPSGGGHSTLFVFGEIFLKFDESVVGFLYERSELCPVSKKSVCFCADLFFFRKSKEIMFLTPFSTSWFLVAVKRKKFSDSIIQKKRNKVDYSKCCAEIGY